VTVMYVLKRFPRLSETFVLNELLRLEGAGETVLVDALLPPEDEPRHPELADLRAAVRYVPRKPALGDPPVRRAHLRVALRAPLRWASRAVAARRSGEWRRFLQAGMVADRVRRDGATHVHAHFATAAAEVARDAGHLARVPVTVTAHAKDIYHEDNAPKLRRRLDGIAGVVTVSRCNVEHLRSVLPADLPVHHVPNGVPVAEPVMRVHGGPVLCVSRLVPKKGVDVLVEAMALLAGRCSDLRLEIAGSGSLSDELWAQAERLGLSDRVVLLGRLTSDEVDAAYRRCSMVVLPCRIDPSGDRDGLPTVLVEAMARALPVISTDIVGIPELVRHDETGLLVPPDDPAALADAIARLAGDDTLAAGLGRAARQLVAEEYEPGRSTALLRAAFSAAGRGKRR